MIFVSDAGLVNMRLDGSHWNLLHWVSGTVRQGSGLERVRWGLDSLIKPTNPMKSLTWPGYLDRTGFAEVMEGCSSSKLILGL